MRAERESRRRAQGNKGTPSIDQQPSDTPSKAGSNTRFGCESQPPTPYRTCTSSTQVERIIISIASSSSVSQHNHHTRPHERPPRSAGKLARVAWHRNGRPACSRHQYCAPGAPPDGGSDLDLLSPASSSCLPASRAHARRDGDSNRVTLFFSARTAPRADSHLSLRPDSSDPPIC
nr:unnamed protein product [Digitaria exilis]